MDTIFINDLRVETRVGVYEWEQHLTQPLLLNVEFELPSTAPFASDKFSDATDYAAVVARLVELAAQRFVGRFSVVADPAGGVGLPRW